MQLEQALVALISIEEKMSEYYEWLSGCFGHDTEARACFEQLAAQEKGHAEQLRFQQRVVRNSKVNGEVALDPLEIEGLIRKIEDFRRRNPRPLLPHAILFALKLEASDVEAMYSKLLEEAAPEIARLAKGMSNADQKHVSLLQSLLAKKKAQSREGRR